MKIVLKGEVVVSLGDFASLTHEKRLIITSSKSSKLQNAQDTWKPYRSAKGQDKTTQILRLNVFSRGQKLNYSPVNLNGVRGDLGPTISRLWRCASARFIKSWIRAQSLPLRHSELAWLQEFNWGWIDSSSSGISEWDRIGLAESLVTWLSMSGQNWRLLSM